MTTVNLPQLHHIAITVTDLDASVRWYEDVFGVRFQMDIPPEGGVGRLLADEARQLLFVLHRHDANGGERFTETATGLDHIGLRVASRTDLEAWRDHLESRAVEERAEANVPCTRSPIADEAYGSVLVFRDPDNIQLELSCPPGT
jgi:glyoxylase I family protein